MELRERLELCRLKAVYGPLLTPRQRECLERCVEGDLSLSEIADELGIDRQSVRTHLVIGEKKLREFERKMGLCRRLDALRAFAEAEGEKGRDFLAKLDELF